MEMCGRREPSTARSAAGPEPPCGKVVLGVASGPASGGAGLLLSPSLRRVPPSGPGTLYSPSLARPSGPRGVRSPPSFPFLPKPKPASASPQSRLCSPPGAFPLQPPGGRGLLSVQCPSALAAGVAPST